MCIQDNFAPLLQSCSSLADAGADTNKKTDVILNTVPSPARPSPPASPGSLPDTTAGGCGACLGGRAACKEMSRGEGTYCMGLGYKV